MGVLSRTLFIVASFLALTVFSFSALNPKTFAQDISNKTPDQVIQEGLCAGANLQLSDGNCATSTDTGVEKFNKVIRSVINTLSLIVGIVAVIMIIIGGLRYITSGGSDTSVTSAKNTILYAIIGLIIVALAQIMVRFVLRQITG
ncbi:hypothetical protein A3F65_02530 [Candidatus Saccharibacteria bacterium RIFCSPHIGHO2_12_FULL_47_16b]|nr:MAG: hypothetical protein A3F65_02530 [Candidatus Saccharibacteria bacterium RIFCSPHIGHO2_12_FULL_47_16b]OGL40320.1 MAG: hypothetical protein A3J32_02485 [Candidatus Saccharibacteria bacterium RIFCSPLOWO2_02_FULL_46_7]